MPSDEGADFVLGASTAVGSRVLAGRTPPLGTVAFTVSSLEVPVGIAAGCFSFSWVCCEVVCSVQFLNWIINLQFVSDALDLI